MFPGSGDVYVRFHDILGTPMFTILVHMIRGKFYPGLYDTSFLQNVDIESLIRMYLGRPFENFLDIEALNVHHFTKEQNENLMYEMLKEIPYDTFSPVNLQNAFLLHPIVDRLHVYTKRNETQIPHVIGKMSYYIGTVDYRYGEFKDIIRDAKSHATLITTSTQEARTFLDSPHPHRYVSLIFPNNYDPIKSISDVYSKFADRITVIDLSNRVKIWKESLVL